MLGSGHKQDKLDLKVDTKRTGYICPRGQATSESGHQEGMLNLEDDSKGTVYSGSGPKEGMIHLEMDMKRMGYIRKWT